jgi:hypothetical protein
MINKLKILPLLLLFQMSFAQKAERKPLHGQVINDSIQLESGYIINVTAETRTFINANGLFDILAKPKDVLIFSGLAFEPRKLVLTIEDCQDKLFLVRLNTANNELEEVVVSNRLKVNSLAVGSQAMVDKPFFDDEKSSPRNRLMPSDGSIENGMNFVRIFKDLKKILSKKENVKEAFIADLAFSQYVKVNFDPLFFERDLKINKDEIDLFLLYCTNDPLAKTYLGPEDRFLLLDFLISKNKEFKRISTFEK